MELAFSEDDYSTQEAPGSTINALITKSGQSSEVVTVRVIPTTFEQYRSQFGQVPFQDIDPAEGEKICMALLGRTKNKIASYPKPHFLHGKDIVLRSFSLGKIRNSSNYPH